MTFPIRDPLEDGITHINIYSKAKTELGRMLSNFARTPITIDEDGSFESIEGYWYWLSCKDDRLRTKHGYKAKKLGKKLRGDIWNDTLEFKKKIKRALDIKIYTHKKIENALTNSSLPLDHYYVRKGKFVGIPQGRWIISHFESLRTFLQFEEYIC